MNRVELQADEDITKIDNAEKAVQVPASSHASPNADGVLSLASELRIWLRALDSFFMWQHHPVGQEKTSDLVSRDWTPEMRIANEAITRARHLALNVRRNATGNADVFGLDAATDGGERFIFDDVSLLSADEVLGDAYEVCEGVLAAPRVAFRAWSGFGRMLRRELRRTNVVAELNRVLQERSALLIHPSLQEIVEKTTPPKLSADVLRIFQELTELLDQLRYVAPLLKADLPLKGTLPLWTLIHEDAKRLVAMIEKRALRTDEIEGAIFDALDGTAYALSMELRKVFAHELSGVAAARHAPLIYSKIETAHGLLRDSFHQSIVTLAQALDPGIKELGLFDVTRTRLAQSLALRGDLWSLLSTLREYERDPATASKSLADLVERCKTFRHDSMQNLMYKDWESFDIFVEELSRTRDVAEAVPLMHRFGAYLDTLFGQVNMRAVLKDHPFDPPAVHA